MKFQNSTEPRRAGSINVPKLKGYSNGMLNVAFDSTGLKVFGEGEWKVRMHGASKRRKWRKLHLALNINRQSIAAVKLTTNKVDDAEVAVEMLNQQFEKNVNSILGDGAYDKTKVYRAGRKSGANVIVPPARNAKQQTVFIMLGNHEHARNIMEK